MKITKTQLKQIIKEEISKALSEDESSLSPLTRDQRSKSESVQKAVKELFLELLNRLQRVDTKDAKNIIDEIEQFLFDPAINQNEELKVATNYLAEITDDPYAWGDAVPDSDVFYSLLTIDDSAARSIMKSIRKLLKTSEEENEFIIYLAPLALDGRAGDFYKQYEKFFRRRRWRTKRAPREQ